MNSLSAHFETLGCRLNQIETEAAAKFFAGCGFSCSMEPVSASSEPDSSVSAVVLNTCAVTGKAEQKDRREIRLLLQKFPSAVLIVTGCYAELSRELILEMDPRIAVLPGQKKGLIRLAPSMMAEPGFPLLPEIAAARLNGLFSSDSEPEETFSLFTEKFLSHSRASLKIQDGCANSCAYCCIRLARGKSVSLDARTAVERCRRLEDSGHKEIVLTGVNLSQYRGEFVGGKIGLAELLSLLLESTDSVRFAVSSLYPESVTEEFCKAIESERVQPRFHLSVQSGSDAVLRAMGRRYSSDDVRRAVEMLRRAKPGCFIACDIIAGFPGETDGDFAETMRLCRDCAFSWVHAFPFSPRPGTPAHSMRPKIPNGVARRRVEELAAFARRSRLEFVNSLAGRIFPAVIEHPRRGGRLLRCVTSNFIRGEFEADSADFPQGSLAEVRVVRALEDSILAGREADALVEPVLG